MADRKDVDKNPHCGFYMNVMRQFNVELRLIQLSIKPHLVFIRWSVCLPLEALIYTIKQTPYVTFNALLVINRFFYTVEGVFFGGVTPHQSESFSTSQYMMNIHNKCISDVPCFLLEVESWVPDETA